MSISNQAKRRIAERHNLQHEAKLNQHYAAPLFDYLQKLCYPIELVKQEGNRVHHATPRSLIGAVLMATLGSVHVLEE